MYIDEKLLKKLSSIAGHSEVQRELVRFCERWHVKELALFGSALHRDFDEESDLDFLITFDNDVSWSLLDHVEMQQELQEFFSREIDLVSKRAVELSNNQIRRAAILRSMPVLISKREGVYAT